MVRTAMLGVEACSGGGGPALCPCFVHTHTPQHRSPCQQVSAAVPGLEPIPRMRLWTQQPAALVDGFWVFPSGYTETVPLFRALLSDEPSPSLDTG